MIPQKKKELLSNFYQTFLKCSLPTLISENFTKKDMSQCLFDRYGRANLTPSMPVLALIARVISSIHGEFCGCWKQKFF